MTFWNFKPLWCLGGLLGHNLDELYTRIGYQSSETKTPPLTVFDTIYFLIFISLLYDGRGVEYGLSFIKMFMYTAIGRSVCILVWQWECRDRRKNCMLWNTSHHYYISNSYIDRDNRMACLHPGQILSCPGWRNPLAERESNRTSQIWTCHWTLLVWCSTVTPYRLRNECLMGNTTKKLLPLKRLQWFLRSRVQ